MKKYLSKINSSVVLPIVVALILSLLPILTILIKNTDIIHVSFLHLFISSFSIFIIIIVNAGILFWLGKKIFHFEKNLFSIAIWYYIFLEILLVILFTNTIILFPIKVTIPSFIISLIKFVLSTVVGIILLKHLYKLKITVAVQAYVYTIIVKFVIGLIIVAITSPILSIISDIKQKAEQDAYLAEKNPIITKLTDEFKTPQIVKDIKLSYRYEKDGFEPDSTIYDWVVVLDSGRIVWPCSANYSGSITNFNKQQKEAFLLKLNKKLNEFKGKKVEIRLGPPYDVDKYISSIKYFNGGVIKDDLNYPFPVEIYLDSKPIETNSIGVYDFIKENSDTAFSNEMIANIKNLFAKLPFDFPLPPKSEITMADPAKTILGFDKPGQNRLSFLTTEKLQYWRNIYEKYLTKYNISKEILQNQDGETWIITDFSNSKEFKNMQIQFSRSYGTYGYDLTGVVSVRFW